MNRFDATRSPNIGAYNIFEANDQCLNCFDTCKMLLSERLQLSSEIGHDAMKNCSDRESEPSIAVANRCTDGGSLSWRGSSNSSSKQKSAPFNSEIVDNSGMVLFELLSLHPYGAIGSTDDRSLNSDANTVQSPSTILALGNNTPFIVRQSLLDSRIVRHSLSPK